MNQFNIDRREFLSRSSAVLLPVTLAYRVPSSALQPSVNFLVVGDWGRDGTEYQRHVGACMAREASQFDSQFIISTGDNFYNLGVSTAHDGQWDRSFESIYNEPCLHKPWYAVLGNHDYGGNVGAQLDRNGVGRWRMPKKWYKVAYPELGTADIELFCIDTVVWSGKESFPYGFLGSKIGPQEQVKQKDWLTEALLSSTAKFKFVFGHHPIYSVGKHGGQKKLHDLDRLLKRAGVTAYVNGHDHCLYHIRSPAMDYICSGGGSQELQTYSGDKKIFGCILPEYCPKGELDTNRPIWLSFVDRAGFASFDVYPDQVKLRIIDRSGVIFHQYQFFGRMPDNDIEL
jgi:tartrate-resistant acid phosphatase type 5